MPGRNSSSCSKGRDAAGKGGTIKRVMENLNPRGARIDRVGEGQVKAEARPVVFPALRADPADRGRNRAIRPLLVQILAPVLNG